MHISYDIKNDGSEWHQQLWLTLNVFVADMLTGLFRNAETWHISASSRYLVPVLWFNERKLRLHCLCLRKTHSSNSYDLLTAHKHLIDLSDKVSGSSISYLIFFSHLHHGWLWLLFSVQLRNTIRSTYMYIYLYPHTAV